MPYWCPERWPQLGLSTFDIDESQPLNKTSHIPFFNNCVGRFLNKTNDYHFQSCIQELLQASKQKKALVRIYVHFEKCCQISFTDSGTLVELPLFQIPSTSQQQKLKVFQKWLKIRPFGFAILMPPIWDIRWQQAVLSDILNVFIQKEVPQCCSQVQYI